MKQILDQVPVYKNICGQLKNDINDTYRFSKHCLNIKCEDGELFFHTLTGELILFENNESINDYKDILVRNFFLVSKHFDENEYADEIKKIAFLLKSNSDVKDHFTILTTTFCNARCFYCYEMGRKRINMSENVAMDVGRYISNACKGREVSLKWFGGEPLYNHKAISIIIEELKKNGILFSSSIISNGFYFTSELSYKAKNEWNLNDIQITIDGTKDIYNRIKAYIDTCKNPFERVLNNIETALDIGINVFIRLNVDKRNSDDLMDVIDLLGKRFENRDNCKIEAVFLRPFVGEVSKFDKEDAAADCYFALMDKAKSYNIANEKPLFRDLQVNHCMADNDSCEVILPDGKIGKCEHFSETEFIGDIYSSYRDQEMIESWKKRLTSKEMPECNDCSLYPRCINLEKCVWNNKGCSKIDRIIKTGRLKQKVLDEYYIWKQIKNEL